MKSLRRKSDRWLVWLLIGNLSFMVANSILLYRNLSIQDRFDKIINLIEMGMREREQKHSYDL